MNVFHGKLRVVFRIHIFLDFFHLSNLLQKIEILHFTFIYSDVLRFFIIYLTIFNSNRVELSRLDPEITTDSFLRLFSRGKPMAPYNTTQFLLEDHEKRTMPPDVNDSSSGMVTHQRQSTGGFSPTHERFILFSLLLLQVIFPVHRSFYIAFHCNGIKPHVFV